MSIASHYDVVIIGGGNLSAFALANNGLSMAVLDKRQLASESSMVNTGLLQYSSDNMLYDL